jgi:hypothetical protein
MKVYKTPPDLVATIQGPSKTTKSHTGGGGLGSSLACKKPHDCAPTPSRIALSKVNTAESVASSSIHLGASLSSPAGKDPLFYNDSLKLLVRNTIPPFTLAYFHTLKSFQGRTDFVQSASWLFRKVFRSISHQALT